MKRKNLEGDFKVDYVRGEYREAGGRQLLVRWRDYNFLGDTWEPEENVYPVSKVQKFDAGIPVTIDLRWALTAVRRAIKDRMTSRKIKERGAFHRWPVRVPGCDHPAIGRALLEHIQSTCRVRVPILPGRPGEVTIEIYDLDDIADVCALHLTESNVGMGNLRVTCGAASYEDMMMIIPPLKLKGGLDFLMELSSVTFNGKDGQPDWPKIADDREQHTEAERDVLVDHAKLIMKQTWSVYPIDHGLKQRGWHKLPSKQHKLAKGVAHPKAA